MSTTPRPTLIRWLLASVGLHLVAAVLLVLGAVLGLRHDIDAIDPSTDLDVEIVGSSPGVAARRDQQRQRSDHRRSDRADTDQPTPRRPAPTSHITRAPLRTRAGLPRSARQGGASAAAGYAVVPSDRGELPVCSPLSMRACRPAQRSGISPGRLPRSAHDAFWGHRAVRPRAPRVVSQTEADGVRLTRHADGGRLLSSTRGGQRNPDLGTVGLIDLARGRVGGRSGRSACNPYRAWLPGRRTLVLLVDTSASVEASGQSSRAVCCAAGAALAALKRGYEVELLNFSTGALHQPPTRNAAAIYATLSTIQRRSTLLPPASRLVSSSARPRDFVLVTDSAIGNLEWTLPAYRKATRTHPGNRALLYLLGDGVLCSQCHYSRDEICYSCSRSSRETLVALQKAGFVPHHVERPSALEQLMARGLRRLVP